jgi:hypothetical protein
MPYDLRPTELPLDIEECRTALWRAEGNVTVAAQLLKVPSIRLRSFIKKSPYLSAELKEASEQIKDIAEAVIVEALTDSSDAARRDAMAKFYMLGPGKDRGYGSGGGTPNVTVNNKAGGTVQIAWADGTSVGPAPPTIEGSVNHE